MPVKRLRESGFTPVGWFYNPNIQPLSEYLRRREAAGECAERLDMELEYNDTWDLSDWIQKQTPLPARETRCQNCISWRMEAAAREAQLRNFEYFSTTLLYSRYQPHDFIRQKGEALQGETGVKFVYEDFRTDWQAGIDLSRAWGVYRQAWCGCVFSEAERYAKKLAKLAGK